MLCYTDEPDFYPLKGSYLFVDSSEQSSTASTTRLQSPIILMPIGEGAACFRFWYYAFGEDVHTLRVYVNEIQADVASGDIALEVTGNHGDQWIMEQVCHDVIDIGRSNLTVSCKFKFNMISYSPDGIQICLLFHFYYSCTIECVMKSCDSTF